MLIGAGGKRPFTGTDKVKVDYRLVWDISLQVFDRTLTGILYTKTNISPRHSDVSKTGNRFVLHAPRIN